MDQKKTYPFCFGFYKTYTLVGPLTGHTTLNRHLTVIKIQEDSLSPAYGEKEETLYHFFGKCYTNV